METKQTQPKVILHDKDIREPLFEYLEETYGKVRILEENRAAVLSPMWS